MPAQARQLPGGRGLRKGEDRRIGQSESEGSRLSQIPDDDLWVWSTVGDRLFGHTDVTGVTLTQDQLQLWYLPERTAAFTPAQVRLVVASAAVSSYIEVALFHYENQKFTRLASTYGTTTSTATGLKTIDLPNDNKIGPQSRLFLGIVAHGGSPVVEGFQSGASAAPWLIRPRVKAGHTMTFKGVYPLASTSLTTSNEDAPLVAYLSKEASLVL